MAQVTLGQIRLDQVKWDSTRLRVQFSNSLHIRVVCQQKKSTKSFHSRNLINSYKCLMPYTIFTNFSRLKLTAIKSHIGFRLQSKVTFWSPQSHRVGILSRDTANIISGCVLTRNFQDLQHRYIRDIPLLRTPTSCFRANQSRACGCVPETKFPGIYVQYFAAVIKWIKGFVRCDDVARPRGLFNITPLPPPHKPAEL